MDLVGVYSYLLRVSFLGGGPPAANVAGKRILIYWSCNGVFTVARFSVGSSACEFHVFVNRFTTEDEKRGEGAKGGEDEEEDSHKLTDDSWAKFPGIVSSLLLWRVVFLSSLDSC